MYEAGGAYSYDFALKCYNATILKTNATHNSLPEAALSD
jgi:hypothetical protein